MQKCICIPKSVFGNKSISVLQRVLNVMLYFILFRQDNFISLLTVDSFIQEAKKLGQDITENDAQTLLDRECEKIVCEVEGEFYLKSCYLLKVDKDSFDDSENASTHYSADDYYVYAPKKVREQLFKNDNFPLYKNTLLDIKDIKEYLDKKSSVATIATKKIKNLNFKKPKSSGGGKSNNSKE